MPAQRIETPDGISWHIETFHPSTSASPDASNDYIVLIPSGEGDCQNLVKVAHLLSTSLTPHHVLTFDMPGFSRSTAPPYTNVTGQLLAKQIIGLLDALKIEVASFYGCSSGALATLFICALYPSRARCGILHEAPFDAAPYLNEMKELDDEDIIALCQMSYKNGFIEKDINDGQKKWKDMGVEYHKRLEGNYVTWMRGYVDSIEHSGRALASVKENLLKRPLFWTVGGLNTGADKGEGAWKSNFELASAAGLEVNTERLHCLHFPSVTIPEELAAWIEECVGKMTTY